MNYNKYRPFTTINMKERNWPNASITKAPLWCSVDLRDGNQALETPMNLDQKVKLFQFLVKMGFKEIEVGFPAASETEFKFVRTLIEENMIPDDVKIQVLTQAREAIIKKTFESLKGVKNAVVHLYNSTSTLQRKVVFQKTKEEVIEIAVKGAQICKELALQSTGENYTFEYSPESFTGTEIDYAIEICEAVMDIFQPTPNNKVILNLPATVEMSTPNIYADMVEYFIKNLKNRESAIISVHTHNDRGTAVAASELALLAGADRVEGTLFGNGERTGNVDLITLGLNLFSQGIDPELDFSNVNEIMDIYTEAVGMAIHPRHPYVGDLVYTAFSGSHQDAIKKGMAQYEKDKPPYWDVPYLPIDPMDVGRNYDPIIRVNSQSGKGGVAYLLEKEFGLRLPKLMQQEFGLIITDISDKNQAELTGKLIFETFKKEYIANYSPLTLKSFQEKTEDNTVMIKAIFEEGGQQKHLEGKGNGPVNALYNSIKENIISDFQVIAYDEHALDQGSDSKAIAYLQIQDGKGRSFYGAGIDSSISMASAKALISALNRMISNS
ncbi:2-isopropylmalate synthase [Natranaerovirga pectinivora]|uniref:2-isopropylmalate synthase n=1 Tax=Natranaerovirga pectinivora TaxID=682400 RepID=A0A4R3MTG6_9FIRM|nr:2-isopropylmalate synthase [Natranaerovirga pectinivora]TCT16354.1 2-isopropylmalate synthase [Natranaerovirga pectinivora]